MAKPWEIDEALWKRIESLLPVHRPGTRGPVPLSDRKCLQGILFVLYTGINWKHLPPERGFGSGVTCWRRFRRGCEAGVWDRLHRMLLSELHAKRITSVIPQRGRKKIIGLGRIRWVVEQAIAHLHQFKRLAVRWDRHLLMHQGFTKLAAALICWRRLIRKA